ncbi:TPA: hypothetical protein ACIEC3_001044 [Enterococcus faecium]
MLVLHRPLIHHKVFFSTNSSSTKGSVIFSTICSIVMRPLLNSSPFKKTVGTAMICLSSISFWNIPPSIIV